jgi:hypothetical protein
MVAATNLREKRPLLRATRVPGNRLAATEGVSQTPGLSETLSLFGPMLGVNDFK